VVQRRAVITSHGIRGISPSSMFLINTDRSVTPLSTGKAFIVGSDEEDHGWDQISTQILSLL
jgi:hypothetical protein